MKILTKDNSQILRGLAILSIVLHNFLHLGRWGFSGENEMSFVQEKADAFFSVLRAGQHGFFGELCELFSFTGWVGVPVFVFLTGYGVAVQGRVYGPGNGGCRDGNGFIPLSYVKRQWLKLFVLMLPAVLFFAFFDLLQSGFSTILLKRGFYLTQLANLVYPYVKCSPGVYWYFGLTFQFYLIWALFGKRLKGWNLLIISSLTLVGLYICCRYASSNVLSIYRHCFTGWIEVFALGLFLAQNKYVKEKLRLPWYIELLLVPLMICLVVLMNIKLESWLFIPIVSVVTFLCLGSLVLRVRYISSFFKWIGRLSACIFVCHPIARFLILNYMPKGFGLAIYLVVYLTLTIVFAIAYKQLYERLLPFVERRILVKKSNFVDQ